jgi:HNH endonuclease
MISPLLAKLESLPATLPIKGAVRIELEEGVPIFRATGIVQARIEELLLKQKENSLSQQEEQELNSYEEIDDYLSFVKGGVDSLENLALACFHCNRRKSDNLIGIDPQLEIETPLFNPRCDRWYDHFIWSVDGLLIVKLEGDRA